MISLSKFILAGALIAVIGGCNPSAQSKLIADLSLPDASKVLRLKLHTFEAFKTRDGFIKVSSRAGDINRWLTLIDAHQSGQLADRMLPTDGLPDDVKPWWVNRALTLNDQKNAVYNGLSLTVYVEDEIMYIYFEG